MLIMLGFLVLFYWSVTLDSGIFQLFSDGMGRIVVHAVSKVRPTWHPRHGQLGFFYVPSLPRHRHGDIWGHLWGVDREVDFSPRPYLLPLFLKRRARKIFLDPSFFPQIIFPSPSSLPLISILRPLISRFPLTLSAPPPSSFTSLPSENSHAIRKCRTSITTISLSHNPTRCLYTTAVGMRGNFSNFRKALRPLRNSHLDPLSPYFNNIMNNNKRPESLITCTWVSSTTIVGVSVRKKTW